MLQSKCLHDCHWREIAPFYTPGLQDALRHADIMGQQQNVDAEPLAQAARASNLPTQGRPDLVLWMPYSAVLPAVDLNMPGFPLGVTIRKNFQVR